MGCPVAEQGRFADAAPAIDEDEGRVWALPLDIPCDIQYNAAEGEMWKTVTDSFKICSWNYGAV